MTSGRTKRILVLAGISLLFGLLSIAGQLSFLPWIRAELAARDLMAQVGRTADPHPGLVYLAFDSASLAPDTADPDEIAASEALEHLSWGWPVDREFYPLLLDRLFDADAKMVILDILFTSPRDGDDELREALDRYPERVVVASNISEVDGWQGQMKVITPPAATVVPPSGSPDPRVGYVNFFPDFDDTIRRALFKISRSELAGYPVAEDDVMHYSLAARVLQRLGHTAFESGNQLFRFAGEPWTFRPRSIYEIFLEDHWEANFDQGRYFEDKIVMVGPAGAWAQDQHLTTFGRMDGPEIHLHALNAALQDEFLYEPGIPAMVLIILAAAGVAFLIGIGVERPVIRIVLLLGASGIYLALALVLFNTVGMFSPLLGVLIPLNGAGVSSMLYDYFRERIERARTRSVLERYVSRNVVGEILDNPSESYLHSLSGVRRPVTVMFTDLRGFTSLAEHSDSEALVGQMNEYFTSMVEAVFDQEGTLDKFMGDAIMAVWGNIRSQGVKADALGAVRAALEMQRRLDRLNQGWRTAGRPELAMGIGLNAGEVVTGNIGSKEKMELTVIGDTVNLASRIEGLCKPCRSRILLGETVAKLVGDVIPLRRVDLVQVKGREQPVEIFSPWESEFTRETRDAFETGVDLYRKGEFAEAKEWFEKFLAAIGEGGDPLAELYLEQLKDLLANPHREWSPVRVMQSK